MTHRCTQLFVSSGDLIADRRFEFAKDLEKRGDLAAAADLYAQAVEIAPGFASAWFALGEIAARLGDTRRGRGVPRRAPPIRRTATARRCSLRG